MQQWSEVCDAQHVGALECGGRPASRDSGVLGKKGRNIVSSEGPGAARARVCVTPHDEVPAFMVLGGQEAPDARRKVVRGRGVVGGNVVG